jgi:hypothetical protein
MPLLTTGAKLKNYLFTEFKKDITFDDDQKNGEKNADTSSQRYADSIIQWLQPFAAPSATVLEIQDVPNKGGIGVIPIPPTFDAVTGLTIPHTITWVVNNLLDTSANLGTGKMGSAIQGSKAQLFNAFLTNFSKDLPNDESRPTALPRLQNTCKRLSEGIIKWVENDQIDKIVIEYIGSAIATASGGGNPAVSSAIANSANSTIGFTDKNAAKDDLAKRLAKELKKDLPNDAAGQAAKVNTDNMANRIATGITNWIADPSVGTNFTLSIVQYQDSLGTTAPSGGVTIMSELKLQHLQSGLV